MGGLDKIQETMDTLNEIKTNIQTKYDGIMSKIVTLQTELSELPAKSKNHSEQWLNDQKVKLQSKIERYEQTAKEWIDQQLKKAQEWVDEIVNEIQAFILELAKSMITSFAGI